MNPNFQPWLKLHVSANYAHDLVRIVRSLFSTHDLSASDFTNQQLLLERIYAYFSTNASAFTLLPKGTYTTRGQKDLDTSDTKAKRTTNLKSNTMYRSLVAVEWYARFLGYSYSVVRALSKSFAWRSRNQFESDIMLWMYLPARTVGLYNTLVAFLRFRQRTYIDLFIANHYLLGTVEDPPGTKLTSFGERELLPFLELALRLFVLPLEFSVLQSLEYMPQTYRPGCKVCAAFLQKHTTVLYYTADNGIGLTYMVENGNTADRRRLHATIPPYLVPYMHFYLAYCRRSKDLAYANKVFPRRMPSVAHTLRYLTTFQHDNPHLRSVLDIFTPVHYVFSSKILFAVVHTYLHGTDLLDYQTFSHFLVACGISMGTLQGTRFYNAIEHMKTNREAVGYLGLSFPVNHYTLLPLGSMRPDILRMVSAEILLHTTSELLPARTLRKRPSTS
jgi:hypothetical protein